VLVRGGCFIITGATGNFPKLTVKLVLASRAKGPANRAEAWACLTANLALPGSGSLAAVGFILSVATGIHLLEWILGNGNALNQTSGDPVENLSILWHEIRWPLAGLAIFAASLLWAAITSLQILSAHPQNPVPPRIV